MIDISKLSSKSIAIFCIVILILAVFPFWLSYSRNQMFMIYGKEFGFGVGELQKKVAELEDSRNELFRVLTEVRRQLAETKTENGQLKDMNTMLVTQQRTLADQDADMWFPMDDVLFLNDGTFSMMGGKQEGRGRWSSPESELTLQLIELNDNEVVLRTNLQPPENKIRMKANSGVLVHMSKWKYKLSVKEVYSNSGEVRVRIERRRKS